jgi:hypothetical protein
MKLTRESIMSMQPGRELDIEIARLLGHDIQMIAAFQDEQPKARIKLDGGSIPVPHYSFVISAAWEVVEHWGYSARVGYQGTDCFCNIMIGFDDGGKPIYGDIDGCKSVPEAICKAALLAKLEADEE